jgi:hypothetical protein
MMGSKMMGSGLAVIHLLTTPATKCCIARPDPICLPADVLDRVAEQIRDFNGRPDDDIDEAEAHRLITELTFVYFLLPVSISNGHTIFRGRPVAQGKLLPMVHEFGPPPSDKTGAGRANGAGDPLFYGGSSDETCFAEIRATAGTSINIAAFTVKPGSNITAHVIGELDHYRRWRRNRFLPAGLEDHAQDILAELHPDVALAVQLVDAFLADRFSRPGKGAYRVTNLIAREFLRSQSIDAIIYPSVAHPGGTNYAIKDSVSRERLGAQACVAVEILNDYGYGSYRGGRYGLAKLLPEASVIPWVTPQDRPEVIKKLKLETEKDPDPIIAWMMRSGSQ